MKTQLQIGSTIDTMDRSEFRAEIREWSQENERNKARSVKYLRFGPFATSVASNAFSFNGSSAGQNSRLGPREGFLWTIRRLVVTGLATGTTPDIVNVYRGEPAGIPVWQLNGNSFGTTFGKGELLLLGGEFLSFANSGNITSTSQITFSGDVLEVASEEFYKIV